MNLTASPVPSEATPAKRTRSASNVTTRVSRSQSGNTPKSTPTKIPAVESVDLTAIDDDQDADITGPPPEVRENWIKIRSNFIWH